MMDFLKGPRGQEFQDITLLVDGTPVSAHKVSLSLSFFAVLLSRIFLIFHSAETAYLYWGLGLCTSSTTNLS